MDYDFLKRRIERIQELRDEGKNWIQPVQELIRYFPEDDQKQLRRFISAKEADRRKRLLDYGENAKREIEKALKKKPKEDNNVFEFEMLRLDRIAEIATLKDKIDRNLFFAAVEELFNREIELTRKLAEG